MTRILDYLTEALCFWPVALWAWLGHWWNFRRVCCWHRPKPIRMGGNPFAKQVTHGLCEQCKQRVMREILEKANRL